MDKINTDYLLVKILSYLPTKDAVTTSILSKRWKFLWMWVPNIEYDDHNTKLSNCRRLRRFIKRKLPLHRAPVMESLRLKFSTLPFQPEDIKQWVEVAVSSCVRELSIAYSPRSFYAFYPFRSIDATLPICLYTCKSLVALKLDDAVIMDVPRFACLPSLKSMQLQCVVYNDESFRPLDVSRMVCFPSLRSLHLKYVKFFDEESLRLLLANCPDLEELVMERECENLGFFSIIVPSLKSLSIYLDDECSCDVVEIVAPSLKYTKLEDKCNNHFLIENMPELEEAYIKANIVDDTEKFLASFSSVKRLTLSLSLKRTEEFFHNFLQSTRKTIYTCSPYWSILLLRLLRGSPKLKVLDLYTDKLSASFNAPLVCWDQLTSVPECLLTSLETFTWTELPNTKEANDMVVYITKNSCRLKSETTQGTWGGFVCYF